MISYELFFFFFQAEDGIRDKLVLEFRRVLFRSIEFAEPRQIRSAARVPRETPLWPCGRRSRESPRLSNPRSPNPPEARGGRRGRARAGRRLPPLPARRLAPPGRSAGVGATPDSAARPRLLPRRARRVTGGTLPGGASSDRAWRSPAKGKAHGGPPSQANIVPSSRGPLCNPQWRTRSAWELGESLGYTWRWEYDALRLEPLTKEEP